MARPTPQLPRVVIYTDGACLGNPGPGGYGVVLIQGPNRLELSGGYHLTTNNRMEIMAAIAGLEALTQSCTVSLISDSQYLVNAMERGWAAKWKANKWMRNKTEKAINPDLWERLLLLCSKHDVTFSWVRGHSGTKENERCDRLAVAAAQGKGLLIDSGYRP
ncbi:MAG: ribonuclease HI [Chloroflexi bacterium]|nr:ribonuclease HI [Chloroflexota bacterium]